MSEVTVPPHTGDSARQTTSPQSPVPALAPMYRVSRSLDHYSPLMGRIPSSLLSILCSWVKGIAGDLSRTVCKESGTRATVASPCLLLIVRYERDPDLRFRL